MGIWTVWEHRRHGGGIEQAERAVFVRDGFSWSALIFGPLWLLFNQMWASLIVLPLLAAAAVTLVAETLGPDPAQILAIGLWVWFAFEARGLRRYALARRGWRLAGIVEADRHREAERRYFEGRVGRDAGAVAAGARTPSRTGPVVDAVDPREWV